MLFRSRAEPLQREIAAMTEKYVQPEAPPTRKNLAQHLTTAAVPRTKEIPPPNTIRRQAANRQWFHALLAAGHCITFV